MTVAAYTGFYTIPLANRFCKNRSLHHDLTTTLTRAPIQELSSRRYVEIVWAFRPASRSVARIQMVTS